MNILAVVPSLMPTVNITIVEPFLYLQKNKSLNFKITFPYFFKASMLKNVDCVVFCRNSNPNEEWIIKEVMSHNIPYIYEIDDDFFEIPYDTHLGRNHRHPSHLVTLKNFIANASLVRTYNPLLAENVCLINDRVEINNVYFHTGLIKNIVPLKTDTTRIIYATSRMADEQQSIFNEALKKLSVEYVHDIEIYFWGAPITDDFLKKQPNVFYLEPIYDYTLFLQKFYSMGFDIGLAPIFGSRFFNSKTNNKYREYSGCHIAGVYSAEPLYRNCIDNEINGILAENSVEAWYQGIKKLIDNPLLRQRIINNAHIDIHKNYSFTHFCDRWMSSLLKAVNDPKVYTKTPNLYTKNKQIDCVLLYDQHPNTVQSEIKTKLISSIYKHTKVRIISANAIDQNDLFLLKKYEEHFDNILILSNNQLVIKHFEFFANQHPEKKIIFITDIFSDFKDQSNCKMISTNQYDTHVYTHFSKNLYFHLDDLIKSMFTHHPIPTKMEKAYFRIKRLIKHNYVVRKILFLISKKNSIKLRIHSMWMLYKLHYQSTNS